MNDVSNDPDEQTKKEQKRRELKEQLEKSKQLAEEDKRTFKSM